MIAFLKVFFKVFYRHRTYGAERLPSCEAIIAPNHASFFDPPLVAISIPGKSFFLARDTLFQVPVLGRLMRHLNVYPVKRNQQNLETFKIVGNLIASGEKVIVFPEGRRSPDGELQEFKLGVASLALKCGCPLVPVYIKGTFEVWPKGRKLPKLFGRTACYFGEAIELAPYLEMEGREGAKGLTEELERRVRDLIV